MVAKIIIPQPSKVYILLNTKIGQYFFKIGNNSKLNNISSISSQGKINLLCQFTNSPQGTTLIIFPLLLSFLSLLYLKETSYQAQTIYTWNPKIYEHRCRNQKDFFLIHTLSQKIQNNAFIFKHQKTEFLGFFKSDILSSNEMHRSCVLFADTDSYVVPSVTQNRIQTVYISPEFSSIVTFPTLACPVTALSNLYHQ